jgi:hypothetical protein
MKCTNNIRGPVSNRKKLLDNNEFELKILMIRVWRDEKIK